LTGIRAFVDTHFEHFNARELRAAAQAYRAHVDAGGKMFLAMAGAMSTAGIGRILAPAIRAGLVHGISCTGANLEEDAFRLIGVNSYESIPDWSTLKPAEELELFERGANRVTDTTIPDEVMLAVDEQLIARWAAAAQSGRSAMPADFMLDALSDPALTSRYTEPGSSWLLAAHDMNIPIWTPGWEDSSTGNAFSAAVMRGEIGSHHCVETGTAQMNRLIRWYLDNCDPAPGIGFFQVGGGIAGDFPICVVPLLVKELHARGAGLGLLLPDHRCRANLRRLFRRPTQRKDRLGQTEAGDPEIFDSVRRHHRVAPAAGLSPRPRLNKL